MGRPGLGIGDSRFGSGKSGAAGFQGRQACREDQDSWRRALSNPESPIPNPGLSMPTADDFAAMAGIHQVETLLEVVDVDLVGQPSSFSQWLFQKPTRSVASIAKAASPR